MLTPLCSHIVGTPNVETGSKFREDGSGKPLGEDVSILRFNRNMENSHCTGSNLVTNKVEIDLNMFGVLMLYRVGGEVDGADIVVVDQGGVGRKHMKLMKQLAKPGSLSYNISNAR